MYSASPKIPSGWLLSFSQPVSAARLPFWRIQKQPAFLPDAQKESQKFSLPYWFCFASSGTHFCRADHNCFPWLSHQTHACSGEIAFYDTYHCTAHIVGFWQEILSHRFCISGNTAPNRSDGSDNRSSVDTRTNRQQHTPFSVCCLERYEIPKTEE